MLITSQSFSQANFSRIGIGLQGGLSTAYTGLSYDNSLGAPFPNASKGIGTNKSQALGGSLDYYFTPFISAGVEYNSVSLKDGPDQHRRQFVSTFSSIEVRGNVAAGQFIDFSYSPVLYNLRNLNASLGFGVISGKNNVQNFTVAGAPFSRQHPNDQGKSEFKNVLALPATIGYNLNIYNGYDEVAFVLGLNYKMVFTFSDDIDGYNDDPTVFANNSKDAYTTLSFSVKYLFGPKGLFYK